MRSGKERAPLGVLDTDECANTATSCQSTSSSSIFSHDNFSSQHQCDLSSYSPLCSRASSSTDAAVRNHRGHRPRRRLSRTSLAQSSAITMAVTALAISGSYRVSAATTTTSASSSFHTSSPGPSSLPEIDFSRMGTVAFLGSYTGIDFYDSSYHPTRNGSSFSSTADSLVARDSIGRVQVLANTDEGGRILATCWTASGSSRSGSVVVGGDFSQFGGASAAYAAIYDIDAGDITPLDSLNAPVHALYCDDTESRIWLGGEFQNAVAVYHFSNKSLTPAPFQSLNGPVDSISLVGNDLLFGGRFDTQFSSNSNSSSNLTSASSAPAGTSTVGFSGFLTPVPIDPSANISISAIPTSNQNGFSDPNVVFCPGGSDGSGNSWFAQNGSAAKFTVNLFRDVEASGLRLGNTLQQGRGTTAFYAVSIPDNTQLTLSYVDPATGANMTCSASCPLSVNPTVTAQDFLFESGARSLTGIQLYLTEWQGAGAGLHRLQLLSSGSSITAAETGSGCQSQSSNVETTGAWSTAIATTSIPGTVQTVLVSTIDTSSSNRPSVTFYPYVASSGDYEVSVLIPGCQSLEDCSSRTTVDVEVFPVFDGLGWTSTIDQRVDQDTSQLVYTGPLEATSNQFHPTITLALPANPASPASGSQWDIVAGSVNLVFKSINPTLSGSTNGTSVSNVTISSNLGYGVFDWPLNNVTILNASMTLPNSTLTNNEKVGFALEAARPQANWTVYAAANVDNTAFVGGYFSQTSNFSNIIAIDNSGTITSLAKLGLNDTVRTLAVAGSTLLVGGDFASTEDGSGKLNHVAAYDPSSQSWSSLEGGVDGPVSVIVSSGSAHKFAISGNFSNVIHKDGSMTETGGFAVWDTSAGMWDTGSLLAGNVSSVVTDGSEVFIAGRISGASANAADGVALVTNTDSKTSLEIPTLKAPSFTTSDLATRGFYRRFVDLIWKRAEANFLSGPSASVASAAFFQNSSDSQNWAALGGNLSGSLLFLQTETGASHIADGIEGSVQQLAISGDDLFVAGQFAQGSQRNIAIYSLASNGWSSQSIPTINSSSGPLTISFMSAQPNTENLIIAGNMATAGGLSCVGICNWVTSSRRFNTLGNGLSSGTVSGVAFAGASNNDIIAVGSFSISGSSSMTYAASYTSQSSWQSLDGLSGPATAVATNAFNANDIWVAGQSASDGSAYLARYDGAKWSEESAIPASATISQLLFVPLSQTRNGPSSPIQTDRLLIIAGNIPLDGQNFSTAVYDGSTLTPYFSTIGPNGPPSVSGFSYSQHSFSFHATHHLALGLIVLIAIAISTGLVLLFVLIGLLIVIFGRRRRGDESKQRQGSLPDKARIGREDDAEYYKRLDAIQQAIFGPEAAAAAAATTAGAAATGNRHVSGSSFGGEEPSGDDLATGPGRMAVMRYTFVAQEDGELTVNEGDQVVVLDEDDNWCSVRDENGKEGFVPRSFLY